jgi:integrase
MGPLSTRNLSLTHLGTVEFLFAIKWGDIDFPSLRLHIRCSFYMRTIGKCESPTPKKDLPLSKYVVTELMYWRQQSKYRESKDWVFASPHMQGRYPYWPAMLLTRTIRPAAVRAGIEKKIGWHTFPHTYSTGLLANGENVKFIQELMRHADSRSTLEIYSQARTADKQAAQLVQMIFPKISTANSRLARGDPELWSYIRMG